MKLNHLAIVVPCYNEEAVLGETIKQLSDVLDGLIEKKKIGSGRLLFVDDGSKDRTWLLIQGHAAENSYVSGLKLAHNVGHQYALLAGLEWASVHADAAVSIDADLQDDIHVIEEMVDRFEEGADIVYGVRKERNTDTWFKKQSALFFYRLLRKMGGDIVYNHADFRLMSRRALEALISYPERNLFLRGIVRLIGFPEAFVYYNRKERFAGESKYPLKKMLHFALDGITSFSDYPLRFIIIGGILFAVTVPLIVIIHAVVQHAAGHTVPGWTSLLASVWFIGGMIMISVGISGIYIGKIYKEVKQRPRYFIEKGANLDNCPTAD